MWQADNGSRQSRKQRGGRFLRHEAPVGPDPDHESEEGILEDGKIIDINDAALRLLGYSREELPALTAPDLYVDPREREYCVEKIKQQGFVQDCPIHLRRKDGKILSCLDSTVLMEREKGQPALYQGILRDITAEEQLQNALAESEAEYRGFFESAPVFAYLTSRDGHLLETNEAGTRLFGYSTQELRRMNVATLYKDPDDRRLFSEKMRKNGKRNSKKWFKSSLKHLAQDASYKMRFVRNRPVETF